MKSQKDVTSVIEMLADFRSDRPFDDIKGVRRVQVQVQR